MKQVILIIAMMGSAAVAAKAQTNRTYYSDMQTQQIYENERRGGTPNNNHVKLSLGTETSAQEQYGNGGASATMQMNSMQEHQGYRMNTTQQYYGGSSFQGPVDMPGERNGYDTSKNNGHCIGCGSGAITDHRRELMNR